MPVTPGDDLLLPPAAPGAPGDRLRLRLQPLLPVGVGGAPGSGQVAGTGRWRAARRQVQSLRVLLTAQLPRGGRDVRRGSAGDVTKATVFFFTVTSYFLLSSTMTLFIVSTVNSYTGSTSQNSSKQFHAYKNKSKLPTILLQAHVK